MYTHKQHIHMHVFVIFIYTIFIFFKKQLNV